MTDPRILTEDQIRKLIGPKEALAAVREGFAKLARGEVVLPSVMGFEIDSSQSEVHVKSAYLRGTPWYSIKVASGFYGNAARGLPVGNGLVMQFDASTGQLCALLLDNGFLTELRTGAAGGLAADLLSRRDSRRIAMIGCGSQARYQLEALCNVRSIHEVVAYGRSPERAQQYASEMSQRLHLNVRVASSPRETIEGADIVVTTTPSHQPIVRAEWLVPGTLVIAVGSDGIGKHELDVAVLARADKIVVDHRAQCLAYGEMQYAAAVGIDASRIYAELGEIAAGLKPAGASPDELIVADLTGVGVQDAAVANAVVAKAIKLGVLGSPVGATPQ